MEQKGEIVMYYSAIYASPIGPLTLCSDGEYLVGLWMEGQKYFGGTVRDQMEEGPDLPVFSTTRNWLDAYFAGKQPRPEELPLRPLGSDFRQQVWAILCSIPYGQWITYGDIAKLLADKMGKSSMSSQAVGGAVGHNPLSIVIPCHRVVGASGSLTGYAGGIEKKIWLLKHEGVDMSRLFVPKTGTAL